MRLDVAAGDYACKGGWIGRVYPGDRCSNGLLETLSDAVVLGPERTPVQDLAYAVRHLVDIALRALSPGINDPNTALVVIDRVRGALARLLGKSLPTGVFHDEHGVCRLAGRRRSHADLVAAALHPIRDAADKQPLVMTGMLEALAKLAEHARADAHLQAIETHAQLILETALLNPMPDNERTALERTAERVRAKVHEIRARHQWGPGPLASVPQAARAPWPRPA